MKRFAAILLCVLMLAAVLVGCGGGDTQQPSGGDTQQPSGGDTQQPSGGDTQNEETPKNVVTLRASTPTEPGAAWTVALDTIAAEVEKNTNGAYKIDVYPNASLSENSEKTMTEQVFVGTLDMCITPGSLAAAEWSVFSIPFQFDSREHIWRVCETDVVKGLLDGMSDKGMKAIGIVENGYRQITNNVKEIKTPADAVGIKLRTPQAQTSIALAEAMGFNAVAISSGELYVALQQGTADGQENALSTIYDKGFYDVQKYLTVVNYNWSPAICGINLDLWNSFDADTQKAFEDAIKVGCDTANEMLAAQDLEYIEKLKDKGMEVYICTEDDLVLWKEACAPVADVYRESVGAELVDEFIAAVEACR